MGTLEVASAVRELIPNVAPFARVVGRWVWIETPGKPDAQTRDVAQAMAERALWIAQREGLDGKPVAAYVRAFHDAGSNMRELLNRIEAGCMA